MSILHGGVLASLFNTHPFGMAIFIAIALAGLSGVFVPREIAGPARLASDESPRIIGLIACIALMAFFSAQLLYGAGRQIWFSQHGEAAPGKLSDGELVLLNAFVDVVAVIAILAATAPVRPNGLKRMGLDANRIPGGVWRGVLAILIMLPLVLAASNASEWLWDLLRRSHPNEVQLLKILADNSHRWLRISIIVSAVAIAPVAEEIFFRGCVQTFLRYTLKRPWPAVLLTSALFALAHDWWTWPAIFVLAVGLGYLYERTGNLWACIVLHSLFNTASILLFHFG